MSKVVVVGLGYVGLPLSIRAAEAGHTVVGVDLDAGKVDALAAGRSYVEDVDDQRLDNATMSGRFTACLGWTHSSNAPSLVEDLDVAVIAVPTPLRDGRPDLAYVSAAGRMLGYVLRPGAAVVLESTTYPGTTEGLLADALQETSGLTPSVDFHLGFSPERIDPGNKVYTLENTPKLVSATTGEGLDVIRGFYDTIVHTTIPVSNPKVAELAKVFENTQANVNIALINEVATICHDLGIDVHEMVEASMTKGHSMARWTPGPGVGGHCLPIDPLYLAWQTREELGRPFKFAELADEINNGRPAYVADRVVQHLKERGVQSVGSEILVLGVAYKPNVGDVRESPAIQVVEELTRRGMVVHVVDPHVSDRDWPLTQMISLDDLGEHISEYAMAVLVTNHSAFDYDKISALAPLVLDCRNAMTPTSTVIAL